MRETDAVRTLGEVLDALTAQWVSV